MKHLDLLFVSRVEGTGARVGHTIHPDAARRLISDAAYEWSVQAYTLTESSGLWEGCNEPGFIVWLFDTPRFQTEGFRGALKAKLNQKEILHITCEVQTWDQGQT